MLSSDSDSESDRPHSILEAPSRRKEDSESSDSEYQALGLPDDSRGGYPPLSALGIDPDAEDPYDWWSTRRNGSQGVKTEETSEVVPEVDAVDSSSSEEEVAASSSNENSESTDLNYLESFQQMYIAPETEEEKNSFLQVRLSPASKWREDTVAAFERICEYCETKVPVRIGPGGPSIDPKEYPEDEKLPETDDSTIWLNYVYGQIFIKLVPTRSFKSIKERLLDFDVDLYNVMAREKIKFIDDTPKELTPEEKWRKETIPTYGKPLPPRRITYTMGNASAMYILLRLNQAQTKNLVRLSLSWLREFGFVNRCQGDWLFNLLAYLDPPLDPTLIPVLRDIATELLAIRDSIADWGHEFDELKRKRKYQVTLVEMSDIKDPDLKNYIEHLNTLIYIIADHFEQPDLVANC